MKKRDVNILQKIIDEAAVIEEMLRGVDEEAFLANDEKTRAVCMTLINIGELVKNLTPEFREKNKQIPWKDLAGLRDVTAHGYFTLRMPDIWIYAAIELPVNAAQIKELLEVSNQDDSDRYTM
ncbi:MAG: DUF86 domain-containing protein [Oscillospiraceae bacterium]|jgi:uncharacterized protein with HEPN domain|nr:DUF86 domain-containing protein [Oscillospiraceae bacterium]